jgi:hypothetical protein
MTTIGAAEWSDVADAPELSDREKQGVVTLLNDTDCNSVVWIPEWLLEDKAIRTVKGWYQLATGSVTDYSDKAYAYDPPDGDREYLPKSEVVVFTRVGQTPIDTPQEGISSYSGKA